MTDGQTPRAGVFEIRPAAPRFQALGLATYYLSHRKPFSDMQAGSLVPTVDGQIRRGHALIAFEGSRVVGYLGWSLYTIEEALSFARTGQAPANATRDHGDVVWVTTVAANERRVLFALAREARRRNEGRSLMAIRVYRNGQQRVLPPTLIVPWGAGAGGDG
ncbi:MAG: hypothetical protein U1E46_07570 [Hyphomicrobiales bacterium]